MSYLYEHDNVERFEHSPIKYSKPDALSFIYDHLGNQRLIYPQRQANVENIADKSFHRNEVFWAEILNATRYHNYRNVVLDGFQITDWFPRSPGLTFTLDAAEAREYAGKYLEPGSKFVYEPRGKELALKGGIGSYHFNPFEDNGTTYYLCTATSDPFCHTGIPLAISLEWMKKLDFSARYKIIGRYQPIDNPIEKHFTHMSRLPKFYFVVEHLKLIGAAYGSVRVTPVVFMRGDMGEGFASYCTCKADRPQDLDAASSWLQDYANRYDAKIVTDYDQQRPAFANVPFSLQNVMTGAISFESLVQEGISRKDALIYVKEFNTVNIKDSRNVNVVNGNNTGNLYAADYIQQVTNHIYSSEISDDIKALLTELIARVNDLCKALPVEEAENVRQDLGTFVQEATKEKPRKDRLEINMETIKKAARNVVDVGKPVLEIAGKLLPLILAYYQI